MKNFSDWGAITAKGVGREHKMLVNFSSASGKKLLGVLWHYNGRAYFAQGDKQTIWDEVARWLVHTKPEETISGAEVLEEPALTAI